MATTAAVTLNSDLMSANISVSASSTLTKAGTTADGLDQIEYAVVEIPTGTQFDLIANTPTASKATKLYVKNHATDETLYVRIMIDAQDIGRLYAGDWMFIPADFHDGDADIEITAIGATQKIEYALFHEGTTLPTAADS